MTRAVFSYILKLLFAAVLLAAAAVGYAAYLNMKHQNPSTVTVDIRPGWDLGSIALILEERGVIRDKRAFTVYAIVRGEAEKLKAGEYRFEAGMRIGAVLARLVGGDVVLRKVTIPEGLTVRQIAALLEDKGVVGAGDFLQAAHAGELISTRLPEGASSIEGYLYPDTYSYPRDITPERLIDSMLTGYRSAVDSLDRSTSEFSEHELITLASIIEKETALEEERPLVSAVIHNRLAKRMRLEMDPTVIYGMGEAYNGNLRKVDLGTPTPYNTYVIFGLPPGPIASPGKGAIEAALNPAEAGYLYFVAKGDGSHEFSTTYAAHRRAVRKYQQTTRRTGRRTR